MNFVDKKRLVVLSSGEGSNLCNILDNIEKGSLFNCEVVGIVSNKYSHSLNIGTENNISTLFLPWNKSNHTREVYDYNLAQFVNLHRPDIIVLSGWDHILTKAFLNNFVRTKIINLHPALINTFPGNSAIKDAWDAAQEGKVDSTGIMVHEVTDVLDVGNVIEDRIVPINKSLTFEQFETEMKSKEKQVLINAIDRVSTNMSYKGKVKNVYDVGDNYLIYHSDRLSAFNNYVCEVENKGYYLSKIAEWWFNKTESIVPNHIISSYDRCLLVEKCEVIPLEFIVRGYICGSLWKNYSGGLREYCGVKFEDGLVKNQKLPEFILTPTTKDDVDEPISYDEILSRNILSKEELDRIYEICFKLYITGAYESEKNNLILVDTKYEFGYNSKGELRLVDEVHTVESSRFWYKDTYEDSFKSGVEPPKIDKDIIRKYVKNGEEIPEEVANQYKQIYVDFYNLFSGSSLTIEDAKSSLSLPEVFAKLGGLQERSSIVIISGSEKDSAHVSKIQKSLLKYDLKSDYYACSAHKNTKKLLELLEDNLKTVKIYITVAGMSNALSGVVACNSSVPTIACPPFKDKTDQMVNINSSLQCPSKCPVMTILSPDNVAEVCNRMLNL